MIRTTTAAAILAATSGLACAQFGVELAPNADFENGDTFLLLPDDWGTLNNAGGQWTTAENHTPGGQYSLSIPMVTGFNNWNTIVDSRPMVVPVAPASNGGPTTLSFWYNMPSEINTLVVGAKVDWFSETGGGLGGTGDLLITDRDTAGDWRQITFTEVENGGMVPPIGATNARIMFFNFEPGDGGADGILPFGTVYFDDVSFTQEEGPAPCPADSNRDGVLNIDDVLLFLQEFANAQNLPGPTDDQAPNGSFETPDPMDSTIPEGWTRINNPEGAYETGGVDGAPAARTGTRLLSASGAPDGGFNSWNLTTGDPDDHIPMNSENDIRFEFFYNIPEQTPAFDTNLFAAKLEFLTLNPDGTLGNIVDGTGDIIIASDLSPTSGWQPFGITIPGADIDPLSTVCRILFFTFDGGGDVGTGKAYFDDVYWAQAGVPSALVDRDGNGMTDIDDVLDFLNDFAGGCP